ncbi:MAG TPA: flavodoxin domain-containing protein, partial [Arachidicoccus sp.]
MLYETKKEIFNKLISIASRDELIWMNGYLSGLLSASNIDDPVITEDNATVAAIEKLTILYATETGNTKAIATKFASATKKLGIKTKLISADQYRLSDLQKEEYFFIVISTQGDGEPPVAATKFFNAIHETDLVLNKLRYGVLALGDSSYPLFCKAGEDVDVQLALRGAKRVIELQKCDTDYEDIAGEWFEKVLSVLNNQSNFKAASQKISAKSTGKKIYEGTIVTNINLNDIGSQKETHHIEIIAQDVMYHSGDALGIIPENPSSVLKEILHLTGINAETKILWQGEQYSVSALLAKKLQIIYLHERVVKKYAAIVQQDIPETRINLTDL